MITSDDSDANASPTIQLVPTGLPKVKKGKIDF